MSNDSKSFLNKSINLETRSAENVALAEQAEGNAKASTLHCCCNLVAIKEPVYISDKWVGGERGRAPENEQLFFSVPNYILVRDIFWYLLSNKISPATKV